MRRKVILHGQSTLTVSLPSDWVKSHHIKKGDELNILDHQGYLKISQSEERLFFKKIYVDFSKLNTDAIHSLLAVLHKSGYDEIEILMSNSNMINLIQERINSMLTGFEIVEHKGKRCVIKSISGDHISDLENLIRRCFLVTIEFGNTLEEQLVIKNKNSLSELLIFENTMNKLTNYCQRLLQKKPYKDEKTIYTYLIVWILESLCDDYRDFAKSFFNQKRIVLSKEFMNTLKQVNLIVKKYYELFYHYSDENYAQFRADIEFLKNNIEKVKFYHQEAELKVYLTSILNRVKDCLGSTAGLYH